MFDKIRFPVNDTQEVSGLLHLPEQARAGFVFAHGAGAGMDHSFMQAMARGLAQRRIASLRYQFAYMENGSKRPDPPALAQAAVRAAVGQALHRFAGLPLVAGGKSFGGRMTSQAQAQAPMEGVHGVAFLGFPLHADGKPSMERGRHLQAVACPMLFIQGTRDKLADTDLVSAQVQELGERATLEWVREADHSFHVLVRSGRTNAEVESQILDALDQWIERVCPG